MFELLSYVYFCSIAFAELLAGELDLLIVALIICIMSTVMFGVDVIIHFSRSVSF